MTEIRNTTADMNAPGSPDPLLLIASAMSNGSPDKFIYAQERAGQQQLVASQMLPTEAKPSDADFEAAGFTFDKPVPGDDLFRPATLPGGWTKRGSDHDMWSYVVDQHGRDRVAIFYKAAFYDRRAFMRLIGVSEYVYSHISGYGAAELVTDDQWATPEAIAAVALNHAADFQRDIDELTAWLTDETHGRAKFAEENLPEKAERHAKCIAIAERFAPAPETI